MSTHATLNAASQDRKARLASLKSLKRKQPDTYQELPEDGEPVAKSPKPQAATEVPTAEEGTPDVSRYLSGRNYDSTTRAPRLGFEENPSESQETIESKAAALAAETKRQAEEVEHEDQPLDVLKLQPKKANWDLKRDLDRKMEVLGVRTDNAIARMVRERIAKQREVKALEGANGVGVATKEGAEGDAEGKAMGIEGVDLVEATLVRQREAEEDAERERREEAALVDES
ncbi:hypothetical protein MBLNU230_g5671t1 [Neophaeotheca triangularis]